MKISGKVVEFCCDLMKLQIFSASPTLILGITNDSKKNPTLKLHSGGDLFLDINYCPFCGDFISMGIGEVKKENSFKITRADNLNSKE